MIEGLAGCFAERADPRVTRRCDHQLITAVCAVIACAESWEDIELYGRVRYAVQMEEIPDGHRQVEDPLGWRSRGNRISDADDDAPRPALCRLSLPGRTHRIRGVALFPLPV